MIRTFPIRSDALSDKRSGASSILSTYTSIATGTIVGASRALANEPVIAYCILHLERRSAITSTPRGSRNVSACRSFCRSSDQRRISASQSTSVTAPLPLRSTSRSCSRNAMMRETLPGLTIVRAAISRTLNGGRASQRNRTMRPEMGPRSELLGLRSVAGVGNLFTPVLSISIDSDESQILPARSAWEIPCSRSNCRDRELSRDAISSIRWLFGNCWLERMTASISRGSKRALNSITKCPTAPRGVVTSSRESNGRRLSGRKVADQSFGRMWPMWVFRVLLRVPLLLTASNIAYSGNDRQQETTG